MSKFIKNLSVFLAGLPLLSVKSLASTAPMPWVVSPPSDQDSPVTLRPLNRDADNLFAGHRSHSSHSSHASHSSHYSGSGSSYSPSAPPPPPTPVYTPPQRFTPSPIPPPAPSQNNLLAPDRTNHHDVGAGQPMPTPRAPELSTSEKRRLQIMRVQIQLSVLGLFQGQVDGVLTPSTQKALRHFQTLKGIPATGLMTTPTLNALGVGAVN